MVPDGLAREPHGVFGFRYLSATQMEAWTIAGSALATIVLAAFAWGSARLTCPEASEGGDYGGHREV